MADLANKVPRAGSQGDAASRETQAVVLVTGANSGIGLEASVKLARLGAAVVMVGRHREKLDLAVQDVTQRAASTKVTAMLCDFASQDSIRKLAADFRKAHHRLDILVNNAGSVSDRRQVTVDGLEQTFAVNHLGYFLLTNLLLDLLKAAAPARIVNVSSTGHRRGDIDFDDLQMETGYAIMRAYDRSKLANVLFTRELARRLELENAGVTVNSLHPGAVATQIWSHAPWYAQPLLAVAKRFMITPEEGANRVVHLAVSLEVEGQTGGYYEKYRLVEPALRAQDEAVAEKLWTVSARLCDPGRASSVA
ncbi:SDR family oxidoreductase [Pendulispora albinea]|uniref:SDR family oxidoreductase n=1 Tax=Pendulispora albinea TaxID=2741071 RepID=A0ABZ2LNN6_9BACT